MTSYNLEYFLEQFEDVCAEDFEGFTQRHFDRIGNMFFAPIKPEKSAKSSNPRSRAVLTEPSSLSVSETHPVPCSSPLVEASPV
jgi:hypothetical protein